MNGSYLGPRFKNSTVEKELSLLSANYKKYSEEELINILASELSKEKQLAGFKEKWNLVQEL